MKNIRIGVLVNDTIVPAWIARSLELILAEQGLEIALVVRNAGARRGTGGGRQLRRTYAPLAYRLWKKLDSQLFKNQRDAFRPVDMSAPLDGVPMQQATTRRHGRFDEFSADDIRLILEQRLDVLVQFGFGTLRGDVLHAAACGVWACQYARQGEADESVAGAWEVLTGKPTTRSELTVLAENGSDTLVLQRSWSATDSISAARTAGVVYWKTASFVPRKLCELRDEGLDAFIAKHAQTQQDNTDHHDDVSTDFDNKAVLTRLVALFGKKLHDKLVDKLYWKQWILLYHFGDQSAFPVHATEFKQLIPPEDRFWADPFAFEHQGRHAIFIEELEYADNIGYLSVINFNEQHEPVLPPVPILKKPYHLSYPHVFEDRGTIYMVPETSQNGTIELYRAQRFPDKWEFVINLMTGVRAVDTTIWHHDGKYWMFTNIAQAPGASTCDELYLFYSEDLLSDSWRPHPANPIVSDVRHARQAGRVFQAGEHWYRPSQDCSGAYGKAIQIHRIDLINDMYYRETPVGRVDPDWDEDIVCTHTLTHMSGLSCIDAMKVRKRSRHLLQNAVRCLPAWLAGGAENMMPAPLRQPSRRGAPAGERLG